MARVAEEGRTQLFEHEVYQIVQLVGAISPPHHVFLSTRGAARRGGAGPVPGRAASC